MTQALLELSAPRDAALESQRGRAEVFAMGESDEFDDPVAKIEGAVAHAV